MKTLYVGCLRNNLRASVVYCSNYQRLGFPMGRNLTVVEPRFGLTGVAWSLSKSIESVDDWSVIFVSSMFLPYSYYTCV